MELMLRLQTAQRALQSLKELPLKRESSLVERDAAIKRFEYTYEVVWKLLKLFLWDQGFEPNSPKSTFRAALEADLLTPEQTKQAIKMCDDRNLSSHTYNEELAKLIFSHLHDYVALFEEILRKIEKRSHE